MADPFNTGTVAAGQIGFAPMPAVTRILSRFDRRKLGGFVEIAIELMNLEDGDPDLEDATNLEDEAIEPQLLHSGGPGCPVSDGGGDPAWIEWNQMRGSQKRGPNLLAGQEDDEDDDPAEDGNDDSCSANEDRGSAVGGDDGGPGDADDAEPTHDDEGEQMLNDVPTLRVFALEPNIFTGEREFLGMSNFQPSFVGARDTKAID